MVQLFVFKGSEVLGYVRQSNRLCIVNLPRPAAGQKKHVMLQIIQRDCGLNLPLYHSLSVSVKQ